MRKTLKFKKKDVLHWYDYHDIVGAWRYLVTSPRHDTFYIEECSDDWLKPWRGKDSWMCALLPGELIEFLVEWTDGLAQESRVYMEMSDQAEGGIKISDETGREIIWKK